MTFGEMQRYTKRFNDILRVTNEQIKQRRLANLMTDLEMAYRIPALNNKEFNRNHTELMQLYRSVSAERSL